MSYKPVIRLSFGAETFDVQNIMASEVAKISTWTGLGSKKEWIQALMSEDIQAWMAAYTLMLQRQGSEIRFSQVDFDTDDLVFDYIDAPTGRSVSPVLKKDDDGALVLDKNEQPIALEDGQGRVQWQFDDDESLVPLDKAPAATSPTTPGTSGSSSDSEPGTPATSST